MPFPMAPRRRPRIPSIEINGETDANRRISGAVAQLGEHLLCKQEVVGSIPSGSTNAKFGVVRGVGRGLGRYDTGL